MGALRSSFSCRFILQAASGVSKKANGVHRLGPMVGKAMAEAVTGEEDVRIGTALMGAGYWPENNVAMETADCEYLIAAPGPDARQASRPSAGGVIPWEGGHSATGSPVLIMAIASYWPIVIDIS